MHAAFILDSFALAEIATAPVFRAKKCMVLQPNNLSSSSFLAHTLIPGSHEGLIRITPTLP
jgi:hypothetical protein